MSCVLACGGANIGRLFVPPFTVKKGERVAITVPGGEYYEVMGPLGGLVPHPQITIGGRARSIRWELLDSDRARHNETVMEFISRNAMNAERIDFAIRTTGLNADLIYRQHAGNERLLT